MTHILADRGFPTNIRQRAERANHQYLRGLDELRRRHRPGGITPQEFNEIRASSRQSWSSECEEQDPYRSRFQTTYSSFHHCRREPDCDGAKYRSRSRPTSANRKHNPQPPRKYITLQMKEAPGFEHNNVALGNEPYKVGKRYEKDDIFTDKQLYHSTPSYEMMHKNLKYQTRPDVNVSVHRWLKQAGVEEDETSKRLTYKLGKEFKIPPATNARYIGKQNPNRYVLGKYGS